MEVANIHVARAWSGGPADVGISPGRSLVELVASSVGQGKAPFALPDAGQLPRQIGELVDHQIDDLALALDAGLCRGQGGGRYGDRVRRTPARSRYWRCRFRSRASGTSLPSRTGLRAMFLCPSFLAMTLFGPAGARAANFLGISRGCNVQCEDCSRIGRKARAGARRPGSSASLLRLPPVPGRPVFPSCACIRVRPSGERVPRRCDRSEGADSPAASRSNISATTRASPMVRTVATTS